MAVVVMDVMSFGLLPARVRRLAPLLHGPLFGAHTLSGRTEAPLGVVPGPGGARVRAGTDGEGSMRPRLGSSESHV